MSKYTTEVRFICESMAGLTDSVGYNSVDNILESAVDKIFDFQFPIFDPSYRKVLCKKILKHYYTREIGAETVGLWKLWLDARLNEIMPYYNEMYRSVAIQYDPTHNVNLTTTHKGTGTESANKRYNNEGVLEFRNNHKDTYVGNETNRTDSISKFSDTPQGMLQGVDTGAYLTNATKNDGEVVGTANNERQIEENNMHETSHTGTENNDVTNTDDWIQTVIGKTGGESITKMLVEFRKAIVNVDMMIIDELKDLFINLW